MWQYKQPEIRVHEGTHTVHVHVHVPCRGQWEVFHSLPECSPSRTHDATRSGEFLMSDNTALMLQHAWTCLHA